MKSKKKIIRTKNKVENNIEKETSASITTEKDEQLSKERGDSGNTDMGTFHKILMKLKKIGYEPKEIESNIRKLWDEGFYFKPTHRNSPYCIMQPPPNVTGVLHMGHGFQTALMDTAIRFNRMKGMNTLWQPGMDHAGIATQMVVENQLYKKGISRNDIGRDEFVNTVWEWKNTSGGKIQDQFHRLGASADWSRSRFTMDEGFSEAVQKVFITLYTEKLIYRGKRLVNWDPQLCTAVSDVEVNNEEENGFLWYLKYPLSSNPQKMLIVATTRPETMFGDVAVAVNPTDQRYKDLIGLKVKLPLSDREIPIIADEMVDPEFGTGCVKITPAHDFNDFLVGQRHDLNYVNILTRDGKLNENVPEGYVGLDRFIAREKVITELGQLNLVDKIEPHKHSVPRGEKTGAVIEPYLTDQWFVNMEPLAGPAIEAVKDGRIKFYPDTWSKTYFHWMNNINDWCISRQLWWGHRIPAWYDSDNNIYVGKDEKDVRMKYNISSDVILKQDEDVLDTWFSAGLWPFVTLGWPEKTQDFATFYPTNVLMTGFDIIFFWVARMAMFGLKFTGQVPFKDVYITGLIYDKNGKKMSKTKGNVLDPIDLIDGIGLEELVEKRTSGLTHLSMKKAIEKDTREEFPHGIPPSGTDALRFTFCKLAVPGSNINFNMAALDEARHFCNKIWNATQYVLQKIEALQITRIPEDASICYNKLEIFDQWILSRLHRMIKSLYPLYENYRFDNIATSLYDFVWKEFCDWYLEFSKITLQTSNPEALHTHVWTLVTVLEEILRLLHPMMPYITENLWQSVKLLKGIQSETIMLESYPQQKEHYINNDIEKELEFMQEVISAIRRMRAEMNISPSVFIPLLIRTHDSHSDLFEKHGSFLKSLLKIESIILLSKEDIVPPSITTLLSGIELYIPMKGLINAEKEVERLNKAIFSTTSTVQQLKNKLKNKNFLNKAPSDVISKESIKLAQAEESLDKLTERLHIIESMMPSSFSHNQQQTKLTIADSIINQGLFSAERCKTMVDQSKPEENIRLDGGALGEIDTKSSKLN